MTFTDDEYEAAKGWRDRWVAAHPTVAEAQRRADEAKNALAAFEPTLERDPVAFVRNNLARHSALKAAVEQANRELTSAQKTAFAEFDTATGFGEMRERRKARARVQATRGRHSF